MTFPPYQKNREHTDLPDGFVLQKADNKEFIAYWATYRHGNEDFAESLHDQAADLAGVPFCYWVTLKDKRVAGVVLLPNNIGDFFLIPPNEDATAVLDAVMVLLRSWSDPEKAIRAQGVTVPFLEDFQRHGFELEESRRWMIRPVAGRQPYVEAPLDWRPVQQDDRDAIAALLHEAFAGSPGEYGRRDLERFQESVTGFMANFEPDSPRGRGSAVVGDPATGKAAAVCLVNIYKGLPTIQFVAVAPAYRRQGLARGLMWRALASLEPDFDWVTLAVTCGIPAETIYRKMGFRAAEAVHSMSHPPQPAT